VNEAGRYGYLVDELEIDGVRRDRNAVLYTGEKLAEGSYISARGEVKPFNYDVLDSISMSYFNSGVNYKIYADQILLSGRNKLNAFEKLNVRIKGAYISSLGEKYGGLALAIVFGNRSVLDGQTSNATKINGVFHIFSVSGLHVAFLSSIVLFVLKKCRAGRLVSLITVAAVIVFYGVLTGFPPSLVRAAVMLSVLLLGRMFFLRFDPLSALSFSAVLILIFQPLYLFELGFQMSFAAMLGITCFYTPLKRFLNRGKGSVSDFISSSIAMSLSANSILIAIAINTFRYIGVYFCLANLVLIPLVSAAYMLLTLFTIPLAATDFFGFLMYIPKIFLAAFSFISEFFAGLPFAAAGTRNISFVAAVYAFLMIFMSKFNMLDKKYKFGITAGIAGVTAVLAFALI